MNIAKIEIESCGQCPYVIKNIVPTVDCIFEGGIEFDLVCPKTRRTIYSNIPEHKVKEAPIPLDCPFLNK